MEAEQWRSQSQKAVDLDDVSPLGPEQPSCNGSAARLQSSGKSLSSKGGRALESVAGVSMQQGLISTVNIRVKP